MCSPKAVIVQVLLPHSTPQLDSTLVTWSEITTEHWNPNVRFTLFSAPGTNGLPYCHSRYCLAMDTDELD